MRFLGDARKREDRKYRRAHPRAALLGRVSSVDPFKTLREDAGFFAEITEYLGRNARLFLLMATSIHTAVTVWLTVDPAEANYMHPPGSQDTK